MNEDQRPYKFPAVENPPDASYPSAVESLSGKWREEQTANETAASGESGKHNSTMLGIGIGVAIVIFLAIVGGFLLLVWTVNR
jgi:hypothetical protein